jgi:hypothetical protein
MVVPMFEYMLRLPFALLLLASLIDGRHVDGVQRGADPPELPRTFLEFPFTAPTGRAIVVGPGGNLQSALNSARRGDEIVLAAGATYTGNFTLPPKTGTVSDGWITIRSDKLGMLPAIGTRVTPAHASLMPKVVTPNTGPAFKTTPGTSGWRLAGIEVTVAPGLVSTNFGLISLGESGPAQSTMASVPSDLVLDRLYVHGQATSSLQRCVTLNSARTQVADSYITECHAKGFDTQAIGGWNGPGPYRIVNNTLRGAGENIMFGGADPSIPDLVPSDIEIRQNYIHTPASWKGVWTKKNLLELKNAARVLIEGNILDGSWTDAQTGWAVVLKSANQSGACRWCRTTDVTFRLNHIRNVGAGINVAGVGDNPAVDTATRRVLISETVIEGVGMGPYRGDLRGFQLLGGSSNITIERTVLAGNLSAALTLDNRSPTRRALFRDNVWQYGRYGAIANGRGPGSASVNVGAPGATWQKVVFVGRGRAAYPPGTTFVSREADAFTASRVRSSVDSATAGVLQQ